MQEQMTTFILFLLYLLLHLYFIYLYASIKN